MKGNKEKVHIHLKTLLFLVFCFVNSILTGCSTDLLNFSDTSVATAPESYYNTAEKHLKLSSQCQYPNSLAHRLLAAENFVKAGNNDEAASALREILSHEPNLNPEFRSNIFEARHALLKKDNTRALTHIQIISKSIAKFVNLKQLESDILKPQQRSIALLLPAKGPYAKAAKTIRDGFLASYYQTNKRSSSEPRIHIYDTTETGGLNAAYEKALANKVDLIVGPLTKSEVKAIAKMKLNLPVLALNTVHETQEKLYQFGLMPEDEAETVALHAHQQGKQCALIVAPKDEWGDRVVVAFKDSFQANNGKIAKIIRFDPSRSIEDQIKAHFHTKSKSNNKIDMIFMAASPTLGRQLKPLLSAQFDNLAFYATSAIYNGNPSPDQDSSLEGVRFCDMPWILNNTQELRELKQTAEKIPNNDVSNASRYFALGLDAHQLACQLTEAGLPIAGTKGFTGNLKMDEHGRIQRHLVCAKFEHGIPVPD